MSAGSLSVNTHADRPHQRPRPCSRPWLKCQITHAREGQISMLLAASIDRVAGPVGVGVALESSIATTRRN
jgi:hypothetical protein